MGKAALVFISQTQNQEPMDFATFFQACRSIPPDHPGFLSVDKHTHVSYTSSRNPAHHDIYSVVRQACVRRYFIFYMHRYIVFYMHRYIIFYIHRYIVFDLYAQVYYILHTQVYCIRSICTGILYSICTGILYSICTGILYSIDMHRYIIFYMHRYNILYAEAPGFKLTVCNVQFAHRLDLNSKNCTHKV